MYENGGIESRRFLFHIYYVIALARLGNRLFSRYGKTENAMPYSFIIALNSPLFQQSLTLRRREYLFCTMKQLANPTAWAAFIKLPITSEPS